MKPFVIFGVKQFEIYSRFLWIKYIIILMLYNYAEHFESFCHFHSIKHFGIICQFPVLYSLKLSFILYMLNMLKFSIIFTMSNTFKWSVLFFVSRYFGFFSLIFTMSNILKWSVLFLAVNILDFFPIFPNSSWVPVETSSVLSLLMSANPDCSVSPMSLAPRPNEDRFHTHFFIYWILCKHGRQNQTKIHQSYSLWGWLFNNVIQ